MTSSEKENLWRVISNLKSMPYPGATYLAYDTPKDSRVRGGRYNWTFKELQIIYKYLVFYAEQNRGAEAWKFLLGYKTKMRPWYLRFIYNALKFSPSVSYTIIPDALSISEDETVIFNVYTIGVPDGTTLYWTLLSGPPNPIVASDFTDGLSSGSFTITGNTGSISRTLIEDFTYDTPESFSIQVRIDSTIGYVVATSDPVEVISLVNPLRLIYTDLSLVTGITDPSDVSEWNTLFDLPNNGDPFTDVQVVGTTEVRLRGSTAGSIYLVNSALSDSSLISIYDYGEFISYIGYSSIANIGFYPSSVLYLPGVTYIESDSIINTGFTQIRVPNCADIEGSGINSNSTIDILDISSYTDDLNATFAIIANTYNPDVIIFMNNAMMTGAGGDPYLAGIIYNLWNFGSTFYYTPTTYHFVGIYDTYNLIIPTYVYENQTQILLFLRTGTPPTIDVGSAFYWEIVPLTGTLTPANFNLSSFSNSFTQDGSFGYAGFDIIDVVGGETFRIDYKDSLGNLLDSSSTYEIVSAPTVTTGAVTLLSSTGATLGGNVTSEGNGSVYEKGILYGTTDSLATGIFVPYITGGLGAYTIAVTGLVQNKVYYYRGYAYNEAGQGNGSILSFETLPTPTIGTVTSALTSLTITNSNVSGTGTITERGIVYSTTNTSPTRSDSYVTSGSGTGLYNTVLSGLMSGTTYYLRAYAMNSGGIGYSGTTTRSTLTPDVTPTPTPNWANVSETNLTSWVYSKQQITGINQTITLNISQSPTSGFELPVLYYGISSTDPTSSLITSLPPSSQTLSMFDVPTSGVSIDVDPDYWVFFGVESTGVGNLLDITVRNGSDGNVLLDTFSASIIVPDVIPNPTPNWPNPSNDGSGVNTTIGQQIQGINTPITLEITWTGSNGSTSLQGLYVAVNTSNSYGGTIYTVQNSVGASTTGTYSFTVNPNEWVFFRVTTSVSITRHLTVKNSSNSGVTLDTVTLTSNNI